MSVKFEKWLLISWGNKHSKEQKLGVGISDWLRKETKMMRYSFTQV